MSNIVTSCVLAGFNQVVADCFGCGLLSNDVRDAPFDLMNVGPTAPFGEVPARQHYGRPRVMLCFVRFSEEFYISRASAKAWGEGGGLNVSNFGSSERRIFQGLSA